MFRSLRHSLHLLRVARVLSNHDALFPKELTDASTGLRVARYLTRLGLPGRAAAAGGSSGERLAAALQSLGPSYIKLGQSLATRADLVGEDVAAALSGLQDHLPPFPGNIARKIIAEELMAPVDDLFQSFDDTPVAAASIAQVHFAVTSDGDPVAVKVLRPNIEAAFERDLAPLRWVAAKLERLLPEVRRLRPCDVVRAFSATVRVEMDLRMEAAAASELLENMGDDGFLVPRVDWDRTGRRVLTTERVEGIPITDRAALVAAGHNLPGLAKDLLRSFLTQAMGDGFFHADLHQGNLFVTPDGRIAAVDFGIMGRLDRDTRRYLAEILLGFAQADYHAVAQVHFDAGYVSRDQSLGLFAQAMRSVGEPILGRPVKEISLARLLAQLFQVTKSFNMKTQPQLLLLQKTMVVAEGVAQHLDPDVNTWDITAPVVEKLLRENFSPIARVRDAIEEGLAIAKRLPEFVERAERAAEAIASGSAKLGPDNPLNGAGGRTRNLRIGSVTTWIIVGFLAALLATAVL